MPRGDGNSRPRKTPIARLLTNGFCGLSFSGPIRRSWPYVHSLGITEPGLDIATRFSLSANLLQGKDRPEPALHRRFSHLVHLLCSQPGAVVLNDARNPCRYRSFSGSISFDQGRPVSSRHFQSNRRRKGPERKGHRAIYCPMLGGQERNPG
jgi:hypothetical protein